MRILVVSNLYPPIVRGGYEVECSEVVAHLVDHHEVLVLTSSLQHEGIAHDPSVRRELSFLGPGRIDTLRAPLTALSAARTMRDVLDEFAPDLAFVWNGADIPQSALRVLADGGTPVAYRVCEHWFGGLFVRDRFLRYLLPGQRGKRRPWSWLVRSVNHLPALCLTPARPSRAAVCWNSETLRAQTALPQGLTAVLERVVYPTTSRVDRLSSVVRRPGDDLIVAFLGRLDPRKGPDVAVRALALLQRDHGCRARLVLAGPGTSQDRARLRALASAEGVAEVVELRAPLDQTGIESLLSRCHAVLVPSVWQEPFAMVAIEAAAASVPVVASDVGGIHEGLHHEEHALLFPPGDAAACAAALAKTLTGGEATVARTRRARTRALQFSIQPYLLAIDRFVEDALVALRTR